MFDITPILELIILIGLTLITTKLIPFIKSKTTTEQQKEIIFWVQTAVSAAEQIFSGDGRGAEKKQYVTNWLAEHGIKVDTKALDAMIESAVYELNNGIITVQEG